MKFLLFLGLATLAAAYSPRDCVVGEWRDWSTCKSDSAKMSFEASGAANRERDHSFHVDASEKDAGGLNMEWMRLTKEKLNEEREACRKAGTCPELARRPTEGPQKCVDGSANSWKCWMVDQESFISIADLGYPIPITGDRWHQANDIWGWTDPENGDEYVIVGLSGGSSFVRVTDPANPVVLGFLRTSTSASTWRDMKVANDHVFIVSEAANHGMQVFDLRTLRGRDDFQQLTAHAQYSQIGNSHNIAVNEASNHVYIVGATASSYPNRCNGGLHMVDVSDPRNPTFSGCFSSDGYVHDTQCVMYSGPDSRYTGREICFGYNENSLTIIDVTSKTNPSMLSRVSYNQVHYTHQGWLTEDQSIALMDDELDEQRSGNANTRTLIWDVSDLESPVLRNSFYSVETAIDHNQYVLGDYTYQSNYEAGLQLLRIDQANYDLERVGYFDVFPSRTTAQFSGSWSNYPYLQSGAVAVTSIEYGLFLLRPDWPAINAHLEAKAVHAEQTRYRDILFARNPGMCPSVVETREC